MIKDLYQEVHKAYGGLLPVPMLTTTFKGECEFPAIAQTVLEKGELCLYNHRYDCFLFADNEGTIGVAPAGPYSQGCDCEVIIVNDCPDPCTALDILIGWIECESCDIKVLVTDFLGEKDTPLRERWPKGSLPTNLIKSRVVTSCVELNRLPSGATYIIKPLTSLYVTASRSKKIWMWKKP